MPLVAIGVPLYNEEEYIEQTISSALNQSYTNFEVLVSDNCSTDRSLEIVQRIAKFDKRLKIHRHKENKGSFLNFEFLLKESKSKYFMWLGAHDILQVDFIETSVDKLENNKNVVAVYPKTKLIIHEKIQDGWVHSDYGLLTTSLPERILTIVKNTKKGTAYHSLFRTEILKKSYSKSTLADLSLFLRVATLGHMMPSDDLGLLYRDNRPDETATQRRIRLDEFGVTMNDFIAFNMYPYQLVSEINGLNIKDKLILMKRIREILFRRFKPFSWKYIIYSQLRQRKIKSAFFVMLLGFHQFIRSRFFP